MILSPTSAINSLSDPTGLSFYYSWEMSPSFLCIHSLGDLIPV